MSADKLVLSGDYYIKTASSGTITLDTGALLGKVVITGNLDVQGVTTQIESTNATIKDNVLVLNQGEPNTGTVSLGTSGLKISRDPTDSDSNSVTLLWDNNRPWVAGATNANGIWTAKVNSNSSQHYAGLEVGFLKINSALSQATDKNYILTDGLTNINIVDPNYIQRLQTAPSSAPSYNDNDIPTKGYVDWKLNNVNGVGTATNARYIQAGNSAVMINDHTDQSATATSYITTYINGIDAFRVYPTSVGMPVINLNFTPSSIASIASDTDLTISANGTGFISINNGISLTPPLNPPAFEVGKTKLYSSASTGAGSTAIMFNHYDGISTATGELISAKKAILLSIIF